MNIQFRRILLLHWFLIKKATLYPDNDEDPVDKGVYLRIHMSCQIGSQQLCEIHC
jgi:hypothetical protein